MSPRRSARLSGRHPDEDISLPSPSKRRKLANHSADELVNDPKGIPFHTTDSLGEPSPLPSSRVQYPESTSIPPPTKKDSPVGTSTCHSTTIITTSPEVQPFRLLDLPTEIRLEVYRACLTRPYDILLSKPLPPPEIKVEDPVPSISHSNAVQAVLQSQVTRAALSQARRRARPTAGPVVQNVPQTPSSARRSQQGQPARMIAPPQPAQLPPLAQPRASANARRTARAARIARAVPAAAQRLRPVVQKEDTPAPENIDPVLVNLLRVSKQVYREARPVLYAENAFRLDINTALHSLAGLHQRSRGQIRRIRLTIPSHSEIMERFAVLVRLSLRYCWKLQFFTINMPFLLPGGNNNGPPGHTAVYANAFDILRWLPKSTKVILEGNITDDIRKVVQKNATLAEHLDELAYARRQLMSNQTQGYYA